METRHTNGNWTVVGNIPAIVANAGENAAVIARIEYDNGFVAVDDPKERDANARLIAAAPELLETLETIAHGACLEQMCANRCICFSCIAKTAIAKVKEGK